MSILVDLADAALKSVSPTHLKEGGKRLDLVYIINGIPMVIGEAKTPVKSSVTWADGATDILHYQK